MGFRNNEDESMVRFPTLEEIAEWTSLVHAKNERIRLKTELAFLIGDIGGPDRKAVMAHLRELNSAIETRIEQLK